MTLHLRFPSLLAALLIACPAGAAPTSISVSEAGAMGEFRPGSEIRGSVQASPDGLKDVASGSFFGKQAGQILSRVKPDREVRGAKEAQIYKRFSRSVVLVLTKDGLGTGTLVLKPINNDTCIMLSHIHPEMRSWPCDRPNCILPMRIAS
jgi:hypothetical protein